MQHIVCRPQAEEVIASSIFFQTRQAGRGGGEGGRGVKIYDCSHNTSSLVKGGLTKIFQQSVTDNLSLLRDLQDAVRPGFQFHPHRTLYRLCTPPGQECPPTLLREHLFLTPHFWANGWLWWPSWLGRRRPGPAWELEVRLQESPGTRLPFGRYPKSFRRPGLNWANYSTVRLWSTEKPAVGQMVLKRRNIFLTKPPNVFVCIQTLAGDPRSTSSEGKLQYS